MTTRRLTEAVIIAVMACGGCTPEPAAQPPEAQVTSGPAASGEAFASDVALYDLLTSEITQLGWPFVCVGLPGRAGVNQIDPPHKVVTAVRAQNPAFRPQSYCEQDFEHGLVVDQVSGQKGGVFVNVWRPAVEGQGTLVRATWYGSLRNGTLVLRRTRDGWSLAPADPSHSL